MKQAKPKLPDEDVVKKELLEYLPDLYQSIQKAVDDINSEDMITSKFVNSLREATISTMITDRAVHYLKEYSEKYDNLIYKEKTNTTVFRINDFRLKIKKLNDKNIAGYNHTPTSLKFCNQYELFNGKYELKNLHLGYKINAFGTLKSVMITCPIENKRNKWTIQISNSLLDQNNNSQNESNFDERGDERLNPKSNNSSKSNNAETGS
jgi:hypothetical protein